MNGLSPLEERYGLSERRMRERAAENASKIIQARRMGATRAVRKSVDGGQRLLVFDARGELVTTIDISAMSDGIVSEIERACVASPGAYQRQAVENPRPVRKASKKAPVLALYDKDGRFVAYADPGDVRTVAKTGDVATYYTNRGVAIFVNPRDVTELPAAKPSAPAKPAAPAAAAVPGSPSAEQVQKAQRLLKTPVRGGSPSEADLTWAFKVLQKVRGSAAVHKSAAAPAPRPSASSGASVTVDGRRIQPERRADGTLVFRT